MRIIHAGAWSRHGVTEPNLGLAIADDRRARKVWLARPSHFVMQLTLNSASWLT